MAKKKQVDIYHLIRSGASGDEVRAAIRCVLEDARSKMEDYMNVLSPLVVMKYIDAELLLLAIEKIMENGAGFEKADEITTAFGRYYRSHAEEGRKLAVVLVAHDNGYIRYAGRQIWDRYGMSEFVHIKEMSEDAQVRIATSLLQGFMNPEPHLAYVLPLLNSKNADLRRVLVALLQHYVLNYNDDFKRSIQKGYEQCRRVEKALMGERDVVIYDSQKCNKIAGVIKSDEVKDCFTIVVTRDSYAYIQTDLSNLLQKESEAHYPWSVGIDDLEAFVLLMKKLKKGKLADVFSEYLDFRERYNGHLMCFDELELAGYFFVDKKHFEQYADNTNYFATNIRMSQIFDAHYACGLGFQNELNMDVKSEGEIPRYERKFAVHNYSII